VTIILCYNCCKLPLNYAKINQILFVCENMFDNLYRYAQQTKKIFQLMYNKLNTHNGLVHGKKNNFN